jgi:hypothetical protein
MSENVEASTSVNPEGLHGLYRDAFTFYYDLTASVVKWSEYLATDPEIPSYSPGAIRLSVK